MNLLRDLRASTRTLFLYEVTTSRHTRLRTIADRLGMTVQGASEYAHGLQRDGLLAFTNGEYRAAKKGVEFLHDRLLELRGFVDRAGKAMAFVETTSAIAGGSTRQGSRVGLFMEDGLLVAYPGRASPSMGVAVHDASKGDLLAVRDLEGIVTTALTIPEFENTVKPVALNKTLGVLYVPPVQLGNPAVVVVTRRS